MNVEDLKYQETKQEFDDEQVGDQQVPLDRLLKEGRWEELKGSKEYQERTIKDRIRLAKKAVTVSLGQL